MRLYLPSVVRRGPSARIKKEHYRTKTQTCYGTVCTQPPHEMARLPPPLTPTVEDVGFPPCVLLGPA